jgi:hypothetical protein
VQTNELRRRSAWRSSRQNLSADEAVFRFEQPEAEAEAKKAKEIAIAQAREQNEAQRLKTRREAHHAVAQKAQEEVAIAEEAKSARGGGGPEEPRARGRRRDRARREGPRNRGDRREREVELAASKGRSSRSEARRSPTWCAAASRWIKTVAEEEERIKDLRASPRPSATRHRAASSAEAEAQEKLVRQIKAPRPPKRSPSTRRAAADTADADLEVGRQAGARQDAHGRGCAGRGGRQGLAEVRVREADAAAIEKEWRGRSAGHPLEKLEAEAAGEEQKGLAARVRRPRRPAIEKEGPGRGAGGGARSWSPRRRAKKRRASPTVRVREAEAAAIEKVGLAEAQAIEKKLVAEATGLAEKATAMKALDGVGREHEEFRLRLEKERIVALAQIAVRQHMAQAQAEVMAQAMAQAKINIVGGDGEFFDRFVKAVTLGQSPGAERAGRVEPHRLGGARLAAHEGRRGRQEEAQGPARQGARARPRRHPSGRRAVAAATPGSARRERVG